MHIPRLPLLLLPPLLAATTTRSSPLHAPLVGLAPAARDALLAQPQFALAAAGALLPLPPPPGPSADRTARRVDDEDEGHGWRAPREGDMRGPCPGLNALAGHGWLPRDGVATPAQIVTAVQEGFNMGHDLAVFVTYAAHLVDGNLLTDLLSIGGKTKRTGPEPPPPAIAGGLNTHGVFEGDASLTRDDAFFGDNHSFNATLFDELTAFSDEFGGGAYDLAAAAAFRFHRIQHSIAHNPHFQLIGARLFSAYAEAVFPLAFFVDGRRTGADRLRLDPAAARGFFEDGRMPAGFWRANESWGLDEVGAGMHVLHRVHPVPPGANRGKVDTYTPDPTSVDLNDLCKMYTDFVNVTVRGLYPDVQGTLLAALNQNLDNFYSALTQGPCTKVPPFL